MKKGTSFTFEESTIKRMNDMRDGNSYNLSLSQMAEHLIKTNPEFMEREIKQPQKKRTNKY